MAKSDSVPWAGVTSAAAKPVTASLNSNVTNELLSPSLSDVSTISTVTVGASVLTV